MVWITRNIDNVLTTNWFCSYLIINYRQINDQFYVLSLRVRVSVSIKPPENSLWLTQSLHALHITLKPYSLTRFFLFTQYYLPMQVLTLINVRVNGIDKCSVWKVYCMILTCWLFIWSYCPVRWYKSRHNVSMMIKVFSKNLFIIDLLIISKHHRIFIIIFDISIYLCIKIFEC